MIVDVDYPEFGRLSMVGSPLKLSGTPTQPRGLAPGLGAHTDDVLRLVCGMDDERLSELRAGGAI